MRGKIGLLITVLLTALIVTACSGGGGGGDSQSSTTTNTAPIVKAGPDQNVVTGSVVQLIGNDSSDAEGDILTYRWSITAQPAGSAAVLSSSTTANPTFTADKGGTYTIQLVVSDGKLTSAPDLVSITTRTVPHPVPDTGQTQDFTAAFGEDSDYAKNAPSYIDNGEVITDNVTGLMWQKQSTDEKEWSEAVTYCDSLTLAGYSDWRIPNPIELGSIIDYGVNAPTLNTTYFTLNHTGNGIAWYDYFWTSIANVQNSNNAWAVWFGLGTGNTSNGETKTHHQSVRCVHGDIAVPNFNDNGDETITDNNTRLMWQKTMNNYAKWEDAISACESLSFGGYSDWRLPNIKELQSIVEYTRAQPAVNTTFFSSVGWLSSTGSGVWSSTAHLTDTSIAFIVDFGTGEIWTNYKTQNFDVRCVRDVQ